MITTESPSPVYTPWEKNLAPTSKEKNIKESVNIIIKPSIRVQNQD